MSASARVPQVDEAVNFRDLALGINDWYNVTPSVRVAIEGLALVVQDQAARLERFEQHFGIPGVPGVPGVPGDDPQPAEQRVRPEKAALACFRLGFARVGEPLEVRQSQAQRRESLSVVGARADAVLRSRASGHQLLQQRHALLAGALEHATGQQEQRWTLCAVGGDARVVEVIPKRGGRRHRPERGDRVVVRSRRREILLEISDRLITRPFS